MPTPSRSGLLHGQEKPEEPSRLRKGFTICAIAAVVVLGAVLHTQVTRALQAFVAWCQVLGWGAPVILGLLVCVLQFCMLPTFPLMVGAGVIFPSIFGVVLGQAIGVASVFGGMWLGSMAAFLLGRKCFKEWAEQELKKFAWMDVINAMIDEQGWWVVLLARMSPLLPAEVFNYACSLTSLTLCSFGIGCLGSLVPTCMWVCSTASAATAVRSANDEENDPQVKARNFRNHMIFIAFNLVFLGVLSSFLYCAVQKYQEKADRHIDTHLSGLRLSHNESFDEDQMPHIKRRLTKSLTKLPRDHFHHNSLILSSRTWRW